MKRRRAKSPNVEPRPFSVTPIQIEAVFLEWERRARMNPQEYDSRDKTIALAASEVAQRSARQFIDILVAL